MLAGCPGRVVGCALPHDHVFLFAGCPRAHGAPTLAPPGGGRVLATTSDRGFMQLSLDDHGSVWCAAYCGVGALGPHALGALVGLHSAWLAGLVAEFDAGGVPCLVRALTQEPWGAVLAHDEFRQLRQQVVGRALAHAAAGVGPQALVVGARQAALDFWVHHLSDFPELVLPGPGVVEQHSG